MTRLRRDRLVSCESRSAPRRVSSRSGRPWWWIWWVAPSAISLVVALLFFAYLSPGRSDYHLDQGGYEHLGEVLASSGAFGRTVTGELRPEAQRTIGYPLFLAAVIKSFGSIYPSAALVQTVLVAMLPPLVFAVARIALPTRQARAAALLTAVFPPLAYWAPYTMSETLGTFVVTAGVVAFYFAICQRSIPMALGAALLLGYAGLIRPTLGFAVIALALAAFAASFALRRNAALARILAASVLVGLVVGVLPSYAYTHANFGRIGQTAMVPGLVLWFGYWQGVWPGRYSDRLGVLAQEHASAERIASTARELGVDERKAARYVAELTTYFDWGEPDPALSFVAVNDWAMTAATENIRGDLSGWLVRGATTRLPVLFAGSIPARYEQINALPRAVVLLTFGLQAALLALALVGLVALWRRGGNARLAGALTGGLLAYTSGIHFPFYTEARYGLVAWPLLLLASVAGSSATYAAIRARVGLVLVPDRS